MEDNKKRITKIKKRCSRKEKKDNLYLKDVSKKFYEEKDIGKKIKIVEDINNEVLIYSFFNNEFVYDDIENKDFFNVLRKLSLKKKDEYNISDANIDTWLTNDRKDIDQLIYQKIRENVENKNEPPMLNEYLWYEYDPFDDTEDNPGVDEYFELAKYYKEMWWTTKKKYNKLKYKVLSEKQNQS